MLACFSFLLFFITTGFNTGVALAGGVTDLSYYGHILGVNFLNVFLLCLLATTLVLVLAVVNLFGYFTGGSEMKLGPYLDSISRLDYEYYREHPQKEQAADFTIAAYAMDLRIHRELSSTVELTVESKQTIQAYNFTLYRGYRVTSVTDKSGNALSFTRDGDYITVHTTAPLTAIVMAYSGYSPILYSNAQAALLPGCFPYYPMAGFHRLNGGWQGYLPAANGFSSRFTVSVDSAGPVYSNLTAVQGQKNRFAGSSETLTLMSGFMEESREEGFNFCAFSVGGFETRPINGDYLTELQSEITRIEKERGATRHLDLKEKKIFQTAHTFVNWAEFGPIVDLGDHMIVWAENRDFITEFAKDLVEVNEGA